MTKYLFTSLIIASLLLTGGGCGKKAQAPAATTPVPFETQTDNSEQSDQEPPTEVPVEEDEELTSDQFLRNALIEIDAASDE